MGAEGQVPHAHENFVTATDGRITIASTTQSQAAVDELIAQEPDPTAPEPLVTQRQREAKHEDADPAFTSAADARAQEVRERRLRAVVLQGETARQSRAQRRIHKVIGERDAVIAERDAERQKNQDWETRWQTSEALEVRLRELKSRSVQDKPAEAPTPTERQSAPQPANEQTAPEPQQTAAEQPAPLAAEAIPEEVRELLKLPYLAVVNNFVWDPVIARTIAAMPPAQRIQEIRRIHDDIEKIFTGNGNAAALAPRGNGSVTPEVAVNQPRDYYNTKVENLLAQRSDRAELKKAASTIKLPAFIIDDVLPKLANGPEIAVYIAGHPEEGTELLRLTEKESQAAAVAHLGRLSERMVAKPLPTSSAGPPITPVSGAVMAEKDPMEMSHAEFRAWRERQEKQRWARKER